MQKVYNMLAEILTSNTRAQLLRLLFDGKKKEHYLRDIQKLSDISIRSIQKEVAHLESLDLLKSRRDGNRIYYSANTIHPLYPDLVSIVEKTVGIVGQLKEHLTDERIEAAFIFGSMAKDKESSESDLDLVVVGEIRMRALTKLLSGVQETIGREINPHIFSKNEITTRLKKKDHFVSSILRKETKNVIGSIDDYR
jgi:predicted nucleotidyltransferase